MIDTHHHFLPKVYVDAVGLKDLASVMPGGKAPEWSVEADLAMMDAAGIKKAMLSISSGPEIDDAPTLLRKCNEEAANLETKHGGRFGSFASLPLPDVDASLAEAAFALDQLGADGVIVFASYAGKYLGDPHFAPLFEELNRRKAVVFIHPNHPPYSLKGQPPESLIEFPFETTRAAASLILSGAMKRWPDISFILSHAGGTLPFLAQRMSGVLYFRPELAETIGDPMLAVRQFWYDTALSMSAPQIAALLAVADPARIIFGTDFPMAPVALINSSVDLLAQLDMPDQIRPAIAYGNAERLLGGS